MACDLDEIHRVDGSAESLQMRWSLRWGAILPTALFHMLEVRLAMMGAVWVFERLEGFLNLTADVRGR